MKILNFSTCMTSKDIAFLAVFFTYKISKLQQIIGGAEALPAPPRFRRACIKQGFHMIQGSQVTCVASLKIVTCNPCVLMKTMKTTFKNPLRSLRHLRGEKILHLCDSCDPSVSPFSNGDRSMARIARMTSTFSRVTSAVTSTSTSTSLE